MVRKNIGRRKGRRTKGYFYRVGRGWFTKVHGRFIPLTDETGQRIRDERTNERPLKEAVARELLRKSAVEPLHHALERDAEVGAVCAKYLEYLRGRCDPQTGQGTAKTYIDRGQTLYDFCYGLPGEFFCNGDKQKREAKGDPEPKRIHGGCGHKLCSEITPADIDTWVAVHEWEEGGMRTRVQAVKRAFNFGVERKMIAASPIRGYKLPKSNARITYLTPEQEQAMIEAASPSFALALKTCIRTGARFGCEFAALRARHVRQQSDRMEWHFKKQETKTKKKTRIILITDREVIAAVRQRLPECKTDDPVFRSQSGEPWTRRMLSQNFRRVKAKIAKRGIELDGDACMYSCRHTYAKRTLEGYWTGKPASINSLARLMGNTIKVCIDHYLEFSPADTEMLWGSA